MSLREWQLDAGEMPHHVLIVKRSRIAFCAVACLAVVGLVAGCSSGVGPRSAIARSGLRLAAATGRSPRAISRPREASRPIADVEDVTTTQHVVALTFDDGPDSRWTPSVLRILREEHATATFFVLGPAVLRHPDLVRTERDQGAEIGCHGWSHVVLMQRTARQLLDDYSRCVEAVHKVVGMRPRLVRPPYGLLMPVQFRELRDAGYVPVVWDVTAAPLAHPRQRVLSLMRLVHPGSIVLLHDGRHDRRHELVALPLLIRELRSHGYTFVTVSQLLHDGNPQPEPAITLERRYCYRERLQPACPMPGLDLSQR